MDSYTVYEDGLDPGSDETRVFYNLVLVLDRSTGLSVRLFIEVLEIDEVDTLAMPEAIPSPAAPPARSDLADDHEVAGAVLDIRPADQRYPVARLVTRARLDRPERASASSAGSACPPPSLPRSPQ